MDADDEFGDLYADVGPDIGKNPTAEASVGERDGNGDLYDEDDEELLYGTSSSSLVSLSSKAPSLQASAPRKSGIQLGLAAKEVDNDELLLYGQLYGVTTETPGKAESPLPGVEIKGSSVFGVDKRHDAREDARSSAIAEESSFDRVVEDRATSAGELLEKSGEIPLGGVCMVARSGEWGIDKDSASSRGRTVEGFGTRALSPDNDTSSTRKVPVVDFSRHMNSPPGLSSTAPPQAEFVIEEEEEGGDLEGEWQGEAIVEREVESLGGGGEDWDSDSEDDIQIVLNDETPMYADDRPADADEVEGSEDEEDLVIVTGDDDPLAVEEQEWDEQTLPVDAPPGVLSANLSLGTDRTPGGEDRLQGGKGGGGPGVSPGVPRIGYSGQGYHGHHSQYKYVRPGAGASSGVALPPTQGSPQAGVPVGRNVITGSVGGWAPGRGAIGRGDWASGGRGSGGQRSAQSSGGPAPWGGGSRGFPSGMEFNLPPTKTVFDVDLDSLEDKPWRRPGVDITDYFNFSFTENTWRQYCRQLSQLRLEATMQSKIRVYESGRSEQDYDPDLPPELAAATGMQEISGDPNLSQHRQQDGGLGGGSGLGRGAGRGRIMPLPGRAIQVEGGGGERRPSADIRRQRSRDSDAIVLQDASEDDHPPPAPAHDGNEEFEEQEEERGNVLPEKERRFYRPGAPAPWEMDGPPIMWERENMQMGPGPMPNMGPHGGGMMPGRRMDVEGPGPFPMGPGMPIHQPGSGPNFGMFPGGHFVPAPVGRGGMVRPPLYNGLRSGLQLPVPGPLPESFPPMMAPLEFHDPLRRRTPPHLTPPRRTPPQGLPADWDGELSNGSAGNWNVREVRNLREIKEFDGNGDWPVDDLERRESIFSLRHEREIDRSSLQERSVDEGSPEGRSEEQKRSISRECHLDDSDWDVGYSSRTVKKQKVQSQGDMHVKSGREEYNHSKLLKSNVRKEEPTSSWELLKERAVTDEEVSPQRRHDRSHSKGSEREGPLLSEDLLTSQKKDLTWNDEQDEELRDRRQHRDRDEAHRRKVKEEEARENRSRGDQDREHRREDQERERRHGKKGKEEGRVNRDERSRRHVEEHTRDSYEREGSRVREDLKSVSVERETERSKEKRKREDDRGKVKTRLEDLREIDGRLKLRVDDLRENDGRGKGRLEERREGDGRGKSRLEDIRESDGRAKGRLEDRRETDGRAKGRLEELRESDGRAKVRLEDLRESDGRAKGRSEDLRESDGRAKGRLEDLRESEGRPKGRLEDLRESDGRAKGRLEDLREHDGRVRTRLEDVRESDGRIRRLEDVRESEGRVKGRLEDLRDNDGRVRGRQEDVRDNDGREKGRHETVRDADARMKRRPDDFRESDGRVKGRLDDMRETDARVKGRLEDLRENDGRGKLCLDEGRGSDGRSRRYDKDDDQHAWDDRKKFDEKNSRGETAHATRNHSYESRKVVEQQRLHKDKRGWEGTLAVKEPSDRNGSLLGLGEDKSYRSHMDGSKKRKIEEHRTIAQFDKASARDPDDLAATNARHKEKKVVVRKRGDEHFTRRSQVKDLTARQHRLGRDEKCLSLDNASSEEEETDRRGRSKLQRWNSRKERDAVSSVGGERGSKWQNSGSGHEEAPSTSHQISSERQQQSRAEQNWKEERKEKQRVTAHSGKRHHDSEVKETSTTHGGGSADIAPEVQTAAPKDAAEKRKERLERLRQQAEEAARRQKNEDPVPQTGSVEEVKQERPARKRRWGNG